MAHRNFDEEFDYKSKEGHSFELGGYTFRTLPVAPPGAFLAAGRGLVAAVRFLRKVVVPEDRPQLERVIEMPDTTGRILDNATVLYAAAKNLLDNQDATPEERKDCLDRLADVVKEIETDEEPLGAVVSAYQLDSVAEWLQEMTLGRPTNSPSPSGNGERRTSNGSKGISPKPERAGKT